MFQFEQIIMDGFSKYLNQPKVPERKTRVVVQKVSNPYADSQIKKNRLTLSSSSILKADLSERDSGSKPSGKLQNSSIVNAIVRKQFIKLQRPQQTNLAGFFSRVASAEKNNGRRNNAHEIQDFAYEDCEDLLQDTNDGIGRLQQNDSRSLVQKNIVTRSNSLKVFKTVRNSRPPIPPGLPLTLSVKVNHSEMKQEHQNPRFLPLKSFIAPLEKFTSPEGKIKPSEDSFEIPEASLDDLCEDVSSAIKSSSKVNFSAAQKVLVSTAKKPAPLSTVKKPLSLSKVRSESVKVLKKNVIAEHSEMAKRLTPKLSHQQSVDRLAQHTSYVDLSKLSSAQKEEHTLVFRLQSLTILKGAVFRQNNFEVTLKCVDLRNNKLAELPGEICQLKNLEILKVDHNNLIALPYKIGNLTQLVYLSATNNKITELPDSLFSPQRQGSSAQSVRQMNNSTDVISNQHQQPKLESLFVNENEIIHLQRSIGNLTSLKALYLHNNNLSTYPTSISECSRINELSHDWLAYVQKTGGSPSVNKRILRGEQVTDFLKELRQLCAFTDDYQQSIGLAQIQRHAKQQGYIHFVQFLMFFLRLERQADIQAFKYKHGTVSGKGILHLLAANGHLHLFKALLQVVGVNRPDLSFDVNIKDLDDTPPLLLAIKQKRHTFVKFLLRFPKLQLTNCSKKLGSALHIYIQQADFKLARKFASKLDDRHQLALVNTTNEQGNTPLHVLFSNFQNHHLAPAVTLANFLIKTGANLQAKNSKQQSVLHVAVAAGCVQAVKFAIDFTRCQKNQHPPQMFNFNAKGGPFNFSILHQAIMQTNLPIILLLLQFAEETREKRVVDVIVMDNVGRQPKDLCPYSSAIYKIIKQLTKQDIRKTIESVQEHKTLPQAEDIEHCHLSCRQVFAKDQRPSPLMPEQKSFRVFSVSSIQSSIQDENESYFDMQDVPPPAIRLDTDQSLKIPTIFTVESDFPFPVKTTHAGLLNCEQARYFEKTSEQTLNFEKRILVTQHAFELTQDFPKDLENFKSFQPAISEEEVSSDQSSLQTNFNDSLDKTGRSQSENVLEESLEFVSPHTHKKKMFNQPLSCNRKRNSTTNNFGPNIKDQRQFRLATAIFDQFYHAETQRSLPSSEVTLRKGSTEFFEPIQKSVVLATDNTESSDECTNLAQMSDKWLQAKKIRTETADLSEYLGRLPAFQIDHFIYFRAWKAFNSKDKLEKKQSFQAVMTMLKEVLLGTQDIGKIRSQFELANIDLLFKHQAQAKVEQISSLKKQGIQSTGPLQRVAVPLQTQTHVSYYHKHSRMQSFSVASRKKMPTQHSPTNEPYKSEEKKLISVRSGQLLVGASRGITMTKLEKKIDMEISIDYVTRRKS